MRVERSIPTESPTEVLDRVLDKGIVSLHLGEAPIELTGRALRVIVESLPAPEAEAIFPPRAA